MLWRAHLMAIVTAQSAELLCKASEWLSPSGAEGATLLAHEASDHNTLILGEGMLLYDAVHAVIVGELVTPDVEHPRYMSTGKIRIPHVQHAGAGPFRSAVNAGMAILILTSKANGRRLCSRDQVQIAPRQSGILADHAFLENG